MTMPVISDMSEGHRYRLAAALELIEACQVMGERLDPQVAIDVLAEAEAQLAREAERLSRQGITLPQATPEDFRDAHAVIAAVRILHDLVGAMQLRRQPSRHLRLITKARDILYQDVLLPLLLTMPQGERTLPLRNATEWFYTLWSPEHLELLHMVLETVIAGRPPKKQVREAARFIQTQFIGTVDLDRIRKEIKAAAD
jgi:hypothetical protein